MWYSTSCTQKYFCSAAVLCSGKVWGTWSSYMFVIDPELEAYVSASDYFTEIVTRDGEQERGKLKSYLRERTQSFQNLLLWNTVLLLQKTPLFSSSIFRLLSLHILWYFCCFRNLQPPFCILSVSADTPMKAVLANPGVLHSSLPSTPLHISQVWHLPFPLQCLTASQHTQHILPLLFICKSLQVLQSSGLLLLLFAAGYIDHIY